jgi:hypothetical protein
VSAREGVYVPQTVEIHGKGFPSTTRQITVPRLVAADICEYEDARFGVFRDAGAGKWRWVHLASGRVSPKGYATARGCKSALSRTAWDILHAGKKPRRKAGVYHEDGGDSAMAARAKFREAVQKLDPQYFGRLGLDAEVYRNNEQGRHRPAADIWWARY